MDIKALQTRLREFAAARDWQPYHAPKNLAMALMVEAAELLELFQWQTLTESRGFTRNAPDKERVADEIADVLLYLLQLADHTDVDVEQAVERKLRKNAQKYPAKHPEKAAPGLKGHLLIDWENVQPRGEELRKLVPEGTDVWIFHGPLQKVDASSHRLAYGASKVALVPRPDVSKKNALDFQLSYYIGYISARQPQERFVVVSNDTGYDPMLEHARELGFDAQRRPFRRQPLPAIAAPVKPKSKAAAAKSKLPPTPVYSLASPMVPSAAQIAWRAIVHLRSLPADGRPVDLDVFMESLISEPVMDRSDLARRASQLLRARRLGLARATDETPRASAASVSAAPSPAAPMPVAQPSPPVTLASPAKTKKKATAKAAPASTKATRQDMQQLLKLLDGLAVSERPARKDMLVALLQNHLGETSVQSLRVAHALAQLQALKRVTVKKDVVSYPSPERAPAPAKKAADPAVSKVAAPKPTAAKVAQAVLASLQKMPKNKPTRVTGLLKFIETHAAKAGDPQSMARQVCALLEARQQVALSPDGKGVTYPGLKAKRAASA